MAGPADSKAQAKALGDIIAAARKQPMNFAMLTGKAGIVVEAHKAKSIDAMRKAAKAGGGGPKGAWGIMTVEGKTIVLECLDKPAGSFSKDVRKHFSDLGHKVQVDVRLKEDEAAPARPEPSEKPQAAPRGDNADTDQDEADVNEDDDADDDLEEDDYGSILKAARKNPFNFAWLLGADSPVLKAHRRKPVEALVKSAKRDGGGVRGAWGKLSVSGKVIILTCDEDPPRPFVRQARLQLKAQGHPFRIEVQSPQGTMASDEDDEVDENDDTAENEPAVETVDGVAIPTDPDEMMAHYKSVYEDLKPILSSGSGDEKKALKAQLGRFTKAMAKRDHAEATEALAELTAKAAPAGDAKQDQANAGGGRKSELDALEQSVDALLAEFA